MRSGDPVQVLPDLVKETSADGIHAYTDAERIYGRVRDARLNQALAQRGMKIRWFERSPCECAATEVAATKAPDPGP